MKRALPFVLCLLALTFGCRTLDPAGVYRGDQVLYESELAIVTSYDVIHTFVTWEKQNRPALARWPQIKDAADRMRAGSPAWFATARAAHDAYKLDPSAVNKSALDVSLALLRTALAESMRYMAETADQRL